MAEFKYVSIDDFSCIVTGFKGSGDKCIVPSSIKGKYVRSISPDFMKSIIGTKELHLPATLRELGNFETLAFPQSLEHIDVDTDNHYFHSIDGVLFSKLDNSLIYYPSSRRSTEYSIPDSTTGIRSKAFYKSKYLEHIYLSYRITNLEKASIYKLPRLSEITFSGQHSISEYAIYGCPELKHIILPKSLHNIGNGAFYGCTDIQSITFNSDVQKLRPAVFSGLPNLKNIYFSSSKKKDKAYYVQDGVLYGELHPERKKSKVRYLIYMPAGLERYTLALQNNIQYIIKGAFDDAKRLQVLRIPKNCRIDDEKHYTFRIEHSEDVSNKPGTNPSSATSGSTDDKYKNSNAHGWMLIPPPVPPKNQHSVSADKTPLPYCPVVDSGRYVNNAVIQVIFHKWWCLGKNHPLQTRTISVRYLTNRRNLVERPLEIGYCPICRKYYVFEPIWESEVMHYIRYGYKVIGNIFQLPDKRHYGSFSVYRLAASNDSILHDCGYRVGKTSDLSTTSRMNILHNIIDMHLLTKQQVMNYLSYFISLAKGRNGYVDMSVAIDDWTHDLNNL